jgi:3-deoxy-D-manno-octulosonic-acid transferase
VSAPLPPLLQSYRLASAAAEPIAWLWLGARARKGKEDASRRGERFGRDARPRPFGLLIWLHAASVGESGVALHLIDTLRARHPGARFLVTTGTRTSAELIARRAPDVLHAYAPLDTPSACKRFIAHWRPDLGVFVESEIWPNLLLAAHSAETKLALVNARLSPKSLAGWAKRRASGAYLFSLFDALLCADPRTAEALSPLRGERLIAHANLKLAAPAPKLDEAALKAMRAEIGSRPLWIAASTHDGEDEIALAAHALVLREHSGALLILIPRHPERGARIAQIANVAPRRALGEAIGGAAVYVADTLGELGLFYALAPVALIAGSLLPHLKGHNPIEAARLEASILSGPFVESFEDLFAALEQAGGASIVRDPEAIAVQVSLLWRGEAERTRRLAAALSALKGGEAALHVTISALEALLLAANPITVPAHASA